MDVAAELGKSCSSSKAERATEETLDAGETARSMEAIGMDGKEKRDERAGVCRGVYIDGNGVHGCSGYMDDAGQEKRASAGEGVYKRRKGG